MGKIVKSPGADPTNVAFIEVHKATTGDAPNEVDITLEREYDEVWVSVVTEDSEYTVGYETIESGGVVTGVKVTTGSANEKVDVIVIGQ